MNISLINAIRKIVSTMGRSAHSTKMATTKAIQAEMITTEMGPLFSEAREELLANEIPGPKLNGELFYFKNQWIQALADFMAAQPRDTEAGTADQS